MTTFRTQVVVVGAGPVGIFAAYILAIQGIEVIVLEEATEGQTDMRASTFHASTLSYLNQIGLASSLIALGLKAPVFQYRIRSNDENLAFDLGELSDILKYPFRLQCEQHKFSKMLADKLSQENSSKILFDCSVKRFEQTADSVSVYAETPGGSKKFVSDYMIGADGAGSVIRSGLGLKFPGFTYEEKFLTLSTTFDFNETFEDLAFVNYVSDPNDWFVLLKAPSAWRVLVPVEQSLADEEILSDTFTDSVFEAITGLNIPINTNHRTIYRVHQRVVESMHQNRIVLAGDAAHLNNPLGGFGMNGGLHDAWNVSWKLKSIIKDGKNPQELLSLYDKQRRAVMGEFVQSQTIRNKKMIEESGTNKEKSEWTNMRAVHADPNARREFMFRQCMAKSLMDEKEIK